MTHLDRLQELREEANKVCGEIAGGWGGSEKIDDLLSRAVKIACDEAVAAIQSLMPVERIGISEDALKTHDVCLQAVTCVRDEMTGVC